MLRRRISPRLFVSLFVSIIFGLLATQGLNAQVDTGAILGTVKVQSGVVPGAKVSITNEGTASTLSKDTGSDGTYIFTPVRIGTCTVTAEFHGFQTAARTGINVDVQQQVVADFSFVPGAFTQIIEVTSDAPVLQTQNASVGQVVDSRAVNALPLNGRNFTFLAQLSVGVNTPEADTRGNAASAAFSANGMRPAQNNYLLDGIDNNSNPVDFLNGTNYVVLPPPDAIGEFKVQTSNHSAQLGRAGGAILNATIKSGTNSLHGTAWEFLRNEHSMPRTGLKMPVVSGRVNTGRTSSVSASAARWSSPTCITGGTSCSSSVTTKACAASRGPFSPPVFRALLSVAAATPICRT